MAQDIRWLQRFPNYCKALAKLGQAVDIVSWRLELADEIQCPPLDPISLEGDERLCGISRLYGYSRFT